MRSRAESKLSRLGALAFVAALACACEGRKPKFAIPDSGASGSFSDGGVMTDTQNLTPVCSVGTVETCWVSEDGTQTSSVDAGTLQAPCGPGLKTCRENGTWSPCTGAVLPLPADRCDVGGADDDCNGVPNEGCPCTDGTTRNCGTDAGNCASGTQQCLQNLWGPCEGEVRAQARDSCVTLGDDANCDGTTNGGCSCLSGQSEPCGECGTRLCNPDTGQWGECTGVERVQSCWQTPEGENLTPETPSTVTGNCRFGSQSCGADGNWTPCTGAIAPEPADACDVPNDDADCNGAPNENCLCVDGATRPCGTDTGNCTRGTQTCSGQVWGDCVGEVSPQTLDSCAAANDDANCNGTPNDGCPCIGNQTRPCNDCGTQTCDPTNRTWGACRGPATTLAQCSSETVLQTCNANGIFASSTCNFVCTNDRCGGECRAPATRCQNNARQACVAGFFQTQESCGANRVCGAGGTRCLSTPGGSCTVDTDCQNSVCVSGICCTSRCPAVSCPASTNECAIVPGTVSTNLCSSSGACRTAQEVCEGATTFLGESVSCDPGLDPFIVAGQCDGEGACAPPSVMCGASSCSLDEEICCQLGVGNPATAVFQCSPRVQQGGGPEPLGEACLNINTNRAIACDENSDCVSGQICCSFSGQAGTQVYCERFCDGFGTGLASPLCASPAATFPPCPAGLTCQPLSGFQGAGSFSSCRRP